MDGGQALAAAHEVEQRLAARRRGRGVLRIVEEVTGGAREEDRVVGLQVLLGDVGRVVGDRRRPGAGLLAEFLDGAGRERDGRVRVPGGARDHQHLARRLRLGRCRRGQRGDHRLDVSGARRARVGAAAAALRARRRQHPREAEDHRFAGEAVGIGRLPGREPLPGARPRLVARERAVLVAVEAGKQRRGNRVPVATLCVQPLSDDQQSRRRAGEHRSRRRGCHRCHESSVAWPPARAPRIHCVAP